MSKMSFQLTPKEEQEVQTQAPSTTKTLKPSENNADSEEICGILHMPNTISTLMNCCSIGKSLEEASNIISSHKKLEKMDHTITHTCCSCSKMESTPLQKDSSTFKDAIPTSASVTESTCATPGITCKKRKAPRSSPIPPLWDPHQSLKQLETLLPCTKRVKSLVSKLRPSLMLRPLGPMLPSQSPELKSTATTPGRATFLSAKCLSYLELLELEKLNEHSLFSKTPCWSDISMPSNDSPANMMASSSTISPSDIGQENPAFISSTSKKTRISTADTTAESFPQECQEFFALIDHLKNSFLMTHMELLNDVLQRRYLYQPHCIENSIQGALWNTQAYSSSLKLLSLLCSKQPSPSMTEMSTPHSPSNHCPVEMDIATDILLNMKNDQSHG
jgi:hypothetical protein